MAYCRISSTDHATSNKPTQHRTHNVTAWGTDRSGKQAVMPLLQLQLRAVLSGRRFPAHLCGEAHESIHQRDGEIALQVVPVPLKLGMRLGDYMELQVPWLPIKQRLSLLEEYNLLQAVTFYLAARLSKNFFA